MKKILVSVCFSIIMFFIILTGSSYATSSGIKLELENKSFHAGDIINIPIKMEQGISKFRTITFDIEYDREYIENIDVKSKFKEEEILSEIYSNGSDSYQLILNSNVDISENEEIINVSIKIKDEVDVINGVNIIISETSIISDNMSTIDIDGENTRYTFDIIKNNKDELYLKTDKYKITKEYISETDNIREYEKDDIYIYRVEAGTTVAEFKEHCITNEGAIKTVYDLDGVTQVADDKLVGTGMKLKVEKDGKEIPTLTIGVTGDYDGNGIIMSADLTAQRGVIYDHSEMIGIYLKAMDIDENGNIMSFDLTYARGIIYKDETL